MSYINTVSIGNFILKGIICTIIAGLIYYLCYRKTEAFEYIKVNFINKIIKKINVWGKRVWKKI